MTKAPLVVQTTFSSLLERKFVQMTNKESTGKLAIFFQHPFADKVGLNLQMN